MVVGVTTIHKKLEEYLKRNYPDIEEWRITFCVLEPNLQTGEPDHYRINISFRRENQVVDRVALAKADPNTGEIIEFKEGYYWRI